MIKEILNTKRTNHISSGKFTISSIGGCWRKKYLELRGEYREEYTEELKRLFTLGNIIHRQMTREFIEKESSNFHLVASEVDIPTNEYISGRIDNVVSVNGENVIIDVKSAGDWTLKTIRSGGDCDENYKNQVLLYMHFTQIKKGILLFVGKSKGDIVEVEVQYDKEKAEKLIKEIFDFFHNYVEKDIEPPKCSGGQWGCNCCGVDGSFK